MLKETIDRMRFEMDEMRTTAVSGHPGSGAPSIKGSVSKSLGAELMNKMKNNSWELDAEEDDEPNVEEEIVHEHADDTDSEGVEVETIITRKRVCIAHPLSKHAADNSSPENWWSCKACGDYHDRERVHGRRRANRLPYGTHAEL